MYWLWWREVKALLWLRTVGIPCISLISCCPFECLQTVYKPLVTSQPFAEEHISLTSTQSSQKRRRCPRWYIRVVGILNTCDQTNVLAWSYTSLRSLNTDLMNINIIYIHIHTYFYFYESQVFPNQFSKGQRKGGFPWAASDSVMYGDSRNYNRPLNILNWCFGSHHAPKCNITPTRTGWFGNVWDDFPVGFPRSWRVLGSASVSPGSSVAASVSITSSA